MYNSKLTLNNVKQYQTIYYLTDLVSQGLPSMHPAKATLHTAIKNDVQAQKSATSLCYPDVQLKE